ncbi:hypothetical protein BPAE_0230g00070 [Botrytis paeoniae]|uniref:Mitochondrial transcription factor 1 n=1 Tax=Botrytis paeoniae TaxID=278948 RepID=A0A4Z1FD77_9HELO|nr:hypothetical protein BPAE_0230g00070 [Botrytis paeoniae]
MLRVFPRLGRTNLLKYPTILQHSRLREIHCSPCYNLPRVSKPSELITPTNVDPRVKRTRRKAVTLGDITAEDAVAVGAVKRRSRKSADDEKVDGKDDSIVEPVKRKRGRPKKVKEVEVKSELEPVPEAKPVPELEPEQEPEAVRNRMSRDKNEKSLTDEQEEEPIVNKVDESEFIKIPLDLRKYLRDAHMKGSTMGDRTRSNIMNGALCDDILDRLKPSLLKHVGCDVIDINPGIGLWSSKIHKILKPRTHLLMEPDAKKYYPFVQPLLDAKDSTYQHIPKSGTVWEHLGQVTTPEFLPHQVKLSRDDPKINEPNDTLLVIANLAHYPRKRYRGFESMSQLVLYQLLSAARSHALFHQYGLIRMLVWIPDVEKTSWLVRHVAQMRKNAVEAQITTEYIQEIASSTVDNHRFVRDAEVALANSIDVVSKMDKMGVTTPKHRQGPMEFKARQSLATGGHKVESEDFDRFKRGWFDEFGDLQKRMDEGKLIKFKVSEGEKVENVEKDKRKKEKRHYTEEYARYIFLKAKKKVINQHGALTQDLINDYNNINQLHSKILDADSKSEDSENSRNELDTMIKTYEDKIAQLPLAAQKIYGIRLDGARIGTEFEKRPMEPLKVYSKEFRPASELCLLDIQPQALWPILRQNYPENYDVFEYIIGNMYAHPIDTVYESLEGLWPGALEHIAGECPSLTDPSKGGAFDLKHLSVRSLTTEMLKEIMEAWMKWPFRPSRFELMTKSGSMVHDPDSPDEDVLDGP